jgi:Tol biopolymer transport system component
MSIDGTAARILIEDACLPSWSPDGKRLAFARERRGAGVYIVQVEGGDVQKIVR